MVRRPQSIRRAYTLVELIIVIALLAVAGAMLVPHMVGRDTLAVQAAVRTIIADLTFAQSDALAHQGYRKVHFYPSGNGYCLVRVNEDDYADPFDAATADYVSDPIDVAGFQQNYIVDFTMQDGFEGIFIESVDIDGGGNEIVYDPLGGTIMAGGVPGSGGTIVLASPTQRYEIAVAPFTGKLTVTRLADAGS